MARRSGPLKVAPCTRIAPFASASRIAAAERCLSTAGAGARASGESLWQPEQCPWNSDSPLGERLR